MRTVTVVSFLFVLLWFQGTPIGASAEEYPAPRDRVRILFLGDSLTAGYGVGFNSAYPALVEKELRQNGYNIKVQNAGVSGDTTAGGLRRLNWLLKQKFDALFLALGANDALRGLPPLRTKENLRAIIAQTRKTYPQVRIVLAGMKCPPSMGEEYCSQFDPIYEQLHVQEKVILMPFLLEGVAGEPTLNLPDRIHPNVTGHAHIAKRVSPFFRIVPPAG